MNSSISAVVANEVNNGIVEAPSKEYQAILDWTPVAHKDMDGYSVQTYRSKKGKEAEVCLDKHGNVVGNPRYLN